ncbi:TPA: restriction endonuclease subunit S [Vibrio parahaemolyticus]|nr:restriction endonuclease subunit S [Vibrio parahaemolyticus]
MTALSETKRYQAYPEYKDSGVEWVGSIPSHWIVTSLKRYTYVKGGFAFSSDLFGDVGKPVIRIGDIKQDGSISLESCKYVPEVVAENSQEYLVSNGQLLMAMTGATIGKAGIYSGEYPALVNQRVGRFEVYDDKLSYRFLWYVLKTLGYQEYIRLTAFGGAQPNISDTAMVAYDSAFPPLDEQTQIADFLDHETAKIDTLIEKQQQLIKLLKEKRQAVISHAVTKGLNSQAPMKDSGVEWLGEVPEHWKIVSVRNLIRGAKLQIQDGNHGELHPVANDYVDDGIPFLMANNVRNGKVDTSSCKRIPKALADKLRIGFAKVGDMLLTHKGTVGEVGIIPEEMREDYWMLTPQVTYYRWLHHSLHNEFFYYQFQSVSVATQLDIIAGKQSTRGYVGLIAQGDIELAIPPLNEQLEIASQLQADVKKHEDLIQKAEKLVLLQKERRTALISAAVTGKIDVRNWQAPISQDQALEQTA